MIILLSVSFFQKCNMYQSWCACRQVDAQATLGNGVVVQVTGELSNGGAPMRRFTQTFVLAAQSPKKYYVHNDIFRYQVHATLLLDMMPNITFRTLQKTTQNALSHLCEVSTYLTKMSDNAKYVKIMYRTVW